MEFNDTDLRSFWESPDDRPSRRMPSDIRRIVYRKLQMIDAAHDLRDLRIPPNNRLEKLHGDREGQYSIRVNDQWRLCFTWTDHGAEGVEFCDYH